MKSNSVSWSSEQELGARKLKLGIDDLRRLWQTFTKEGQRAPYFVWAHV